ncbi:MAG: hypothetical protein SWE60_09760 [Thermodesulfobacteriota bacterium]|nr:hypothetical protein [Thermodesulfobacteriota bacterium]
MKKAFLLMVIALASLNPAPRPCHGQLDHETGSEVTFDSVTGRYWYYDITRFSHMTFDEQLEEIEGLSVEGFEGHWHMATYEEMAALWDHTPEALFFGFALTRGDHAGGQGYTLGRYNEHADADSHYFAYVGTMAEEGYEKSVLNYLDISQDSDHYGLLGAWVVFQEEADTEGLSTRSSILGHGSRRYHLDKDMFRLEGVEGERVMVRLEPDPTGSHSGTYATVILKDKIDAVRFLRVETRTLPTEMTATLPQTGQYQIWIQEQRRHGRNVPFRGDYLLTLETSHDAWETLQSSLWVE